MEALCAIFCLIQEFVSDIIKIKQVSGKTNEYIIKYSVQNWKRPLKKRGNY
jgi:hypothetical protein